MVRACWQAILSRMYGTDDMNREGTPTCFHDGKTYRQLKKISLFDLIRAGCSDDDTRALTKVYDCHYSIYEEVPIEWAIPRLCEFLVKEGFIEEVK